MTWKEHVAEKVTVGLVLIYYVALFYAAYKGWQVVNHFVVKYW